MRTLSIGIIPLSIFFVFLWSSGWIGSKYALGYAGTFTLLMWRYALVVATLLILVSIFNAWKPLRISELISHLVVGVLSHAIYLSTSLSAMDLGVSVGLVAFVLALQPLITAVISAPLTGETVSVRQWLGLFLGLLAVLLVIGDRISLGGSPFAYALLLASTVAISLATLISRRMELKIQQGNKAETPILLMLLIHCIGALAIIIPMAGFFENFNATWGEPLIFSITWLAWVVSLSAYGLMFVLLRKLPAIKVSCLLYLSPPATMLIAYFAFGERLGHIDLIGLFIAAIAVWIVSAPELRQSRLAVN
ncbi:MAG: DMT family transporter [Thiolinea sp.]